MALPAIARLAAVAQCGIGWQRAADEFGGFVRAPELNTRWMADAECGDGHERSEPGGVQSARGAQPEPRAEERAADTGDRHSSGDPSPVNGFWRASDWLYCRDNRWRPVMSIHVALASRASSELGQMRSGDEKEREKIGEPESQGMAAEELRDMPCGNDAQAEGEWFPGRFLGTSSAGNIAIKSAWRSGSKKGNLRQPGDHAGEGLASDEACLRKLRENDNPARTPSGRESTEQLAVEFDDLVRFLSPSCSLAELHGDWDTVAALSVLQQAIRESAPLQYASQSPTEIWASLGEEAKNRLRLGFDAARWRLVVPFPLARNIKSRVGRLRAYGNAICVPQAQAFIEAVMSV